MVGLKEMKNKTVDEILKPAHCYDYPNQNFHHYDYFKTKKIVEKLRSKIIKLGKGQNISFKQFKSVFNWIENEIIATKLNDKELREEFKLFKKENK